MIFQKKIFLQNTFKFPSFSFKYSIFNCKTFKFPSFSFKYSIFKKLKMHILRSKMEPIPYLGNQNKNFHKFKG